ncbi:MAG: UMP kinase [Candidatus Aenigmarchaeota archaeon]|nr:UMP kinase [Candidatus Aenigmarchaeota archaeon]
MRIVIKVGGSQAFTDYGPNKAYLERLIPILKCIDKEHQLIVCIGGGQFIRKYLRDVKKFSLTDSEIEWIFVEMLRVNVKLFSLLLKKRPIYDLNEVRKNTEGVVGGIEPGRSTDANAALCAEKIKADLFIKLTDVDGIYDKDPDKYKDAKKLDKINAGNLDDFMIKGKPGSYGVLDSLAIKVIKRSKIKTVVIDGSNPEDILKVIKGEKIGTLISD